MNRYKIHEYSDIINLPHHVSAKYPPIPNSERAAQFGSFSPLYGHDEAIDETARVTDDEIILDEYAIAKINEKLNLLNCIIDTKPLVSLKFFKKDDKKHGGVYLSYSGNLRRIDEVNKILQFTDGTEIAIDDIYSID